MRVSLLADMNWESKIDHATRVVDLQSFLGSDYGFGLASLVINLNCRDPHLGHKQRIRHVKATSALFVDVMLDLPYFVEATHADRRRKIAEQISIQIGDVLTKRKIKNFDFQSFLLDLDRILNEQLNGPMSTRFDQYCLERAAI